MRCGWASECGWGERTSPTMLCGERRQRERTSPSLWRIEDRTATDRESGESATAEESVAESGDWCARGMSLWVLESQVCVPTRDQSKLLLGARAGLTSEPLHQHHAIRIGGRPLSRRRSLVTLPTWRPAAFAHLNSRYNRPHHCTRHQNNIISTYAKPKATRTQQNAIYKYVVMGEKQHAL